MIPPLSTTDRPVLPPEPLEPRRLLSATVVHHVLQIDGTPRSDAIVVTRGKRAVTVDVNGQAAEFSLRSFGAIHIRAGKGDDSVTIGTRDNPITIPASVSAGEGNDLVIGSDANDTIAGDNGDDEISAAGGDDVVRGGAGNDTIFGGDGDDQLSGDNNADRIFANAGNDTVHGGRGDDELHDGLGKDAVYGDGGADHFCVAEGRKEFRDTGKDESMTTDQDSGIELTAIPGPPSHFGGATVAYGLRGDADLNGTFDFNDLVKLAKSHGEAWADGDFNYGGITDFNDLVKMAQNFNSPLPSTPATSDESAHWVNFDDLFANPHAST